MAQKNIQVNRIADKMIKCDLRNSFGDLAMQIPFVIDQEFYFSSSTLPEPIPYMESDRIIIKKSNKSYQSYTNTRVDAVFIQAHKDTLRHLSLLFFASVFHANPPEISLRLTHPSTHIKELILDYEFPSEKNLSVGYNTRPYIFLYYPSEVRKYPIGDWKVTGWDLPSFNLTNKDDCIGDKDEDWNNRNIIRCAGSDSGNILFAELLLNLSRPQETCNEVRLEGELGYGGVCPGSAEVSLYLPGSLGWDGEL